MAKVTTLVDDYDAKPIAEDDGGTVVFSLQDEWFSIDLSSANLAKLTKALQPFMDKALSIEPPQPEPVARPGRGRLPASRRIQLPGAGKEYLQAVRVWARANGFEVSDRGRVAGNIQEAYEAAHK